MFFLSCILPDVQMYVCNKETYGYFPVPMRSHATLQDEEESFLHTHLEVMGESRGQRTLRNTTMISLCSTVLAKGCESACDEALKQTLGCDYTWLSLCTVEVCWFQMYQCVVCPQLYLSFLMSCCAGLQVLNLMGFSNLFLTKLGFFFLL